MNFIWNAPALKAYPAGLRRLLLRLLSEENGYYAGGKLRQNLYRLGWEYSWHADWDGIYLFAEGLVENLPKALELLYAMVAYPLLSGPLVRHHLNRLVEAEARARANPAYQADMRLDTYLWGFSYADIGSVSLEAFAEMDTSQLISYCERFLWKGLWGAVLLAPFVPPQLSSWARWCKGVYYQLPIPLDRLLVCETVPYEAQQVSLRLAYPWLSPSHPSYAYYRLALMRLGGYFGAQLMRSVREEGGLTYGIYARPSVHKAGSFFIISAEVARERAQEAVGRIGAEIDSWAQTPFPDEASLAEARNYLLVQSMPEGLSEWAQRVVRIVSAGLEPESFIHQNQQIEAISQLSDFPKLPLPTQPTVQIAVGTEAPIFAAACA
ncbi:MAG: insulinase family protein [Bacteroidia bacterium]|nr:insulinase family protein [Bacteroidia bacterium]